MPLPQQPRADMDNIRSMDEMRLKDDAPSFSRPSSTERRYIIRLADIPETVPGPNAFAHHAARVERHRMDSNAFYQQQVHKRTATPPDILLHPALRLRSASDPPTPPRDSYCTTMSPFVNGRQHQNDDFPPLKLVPSDADLAEPTRRGMIEERFERMQHERCGSKDERTPVFIPTPKIASSDFANPAGTPPRKRDARDDGTATQSSKTPKKGLLGKLKLPGNLRGISSPSSVTLSSLGESQSEHRMPVKAQAVLGKSPPKDRANLGSSPSKISIPRSPSKRKNFFSRKASTTAVPNMSTSNTAHEPIEVEEPTTALSDPTHYSYQNTRIVSHTNSDQGAGKSVPSNQCAITRSQSLKYFDQTRPPTPPAKNTPPHEKGTREAAPIHVISRLPLQDPLKSPSKESSGLVSTNGRLSPTKFGTYGYKDMPTLVTRPSVYSMRASVVPNLTEANTFEEMKARVDGLSLEGFNMPAENVRSPKHGHVYSPSVYSSDWAPRPSSVLQMPAPTAKEPGRNSHNTSVRTKGSSSSGGEIQICYPELAKDLSANSLTALPGKHIVFADEKCRARKPAEAHCPHHGNTHSRDHSPDPRLSANSSLFARHVGNDRDEPPNGSPILFNHPSAAPSPLHLPATVYVPPPRTVGRLQKSQTQAMADTGAAVEHDEINGLGIKTHLKRSDSATPRHSNNIVFDNAPDFAADVQQSSSRSRTPSPYGSIKDSHFSSDVDVDPKKNYAVKTESLDAAKLDRVLVMLNKLHTRNSEVLSMRAEIREINERLDQRLAAIEKLRGPSPTPTMTTVASSATSDSFSVEPDMMVARDASVEHRVLSKTALDFYRQAQEASESGAAIPTIISHHHDRDAEVVVEHGRVAQLMETNRCLVEMMGGLADKIDALEKRVRK